MKFPRVSPLVWLLASVVLLYAPSIFFGRAFVDFDSFSIAYPLAGYFAAHPFNWLGAAYTNAFYGGANVAFNPVVGLFGFLMTLMPAGISFIAFWNALVCGFFLLFAWVTYVFFRDRGFHAMEAATLATVVIFSQRFMGFFSAWIWVAGYFVFPAMCVVLKRYANTAKWWWIGIGGVVGAMAVFFGQPSLLIYLALPLAAYAVMLAVTLWRQDRKKGIRFVLGGLGMGIVALLLSGWYLLPLTQLAGDTPRAQGFSFQEAQADALGVGNIVQTVLPHWSLWTSSEATMFVIALAFVFFALSFTRPAQDSDERFWRWVILACVIYALPYSPLAWIGHQLPVLKSVREPGRMLFAAIFGIGILAGHGLRVYRTQWETLSVSFFGRALRIIVSVMIGAIVAGSLFALAGGFGWLERLAIQLFDAKFSRGTTGMSSDHYHAVISAMIGSVRDAVSVLNPMTLVVLAGLGFAWMVVKRQTVMTERILLSGMMLCSVAYALVFGWNAQGVSAKAITTDPASAQFIRAQTDADLYRAYTLFFGSSKFEFLDTPSLGRASAEDQYTYGRDLLTVETNLLHGVQSIDGYDNFMTRRTSNLLNEVMSEAMPSGNMLARSDRTRAEKIALFNERLNILGMMNVKYVLSAYELPTSTLSIAWTGETTSRHIPIRIYDNPLVMPRVYLASSVTIIPEDEDAALAEILKSGRDFQKETLLECASCATSPDLRAMASDRVEITSYAPGDVSIRTSTSGTRLLVLNENRVRGWSVTVDGVTQQDFPANYLYQGALIPAGVHEVRFVYRRMP
jgi:hypothetical protein